MPITREEVIPVQEDITCDECGGEMIPPEYVLASYPPKYRYSCADCGNVQTTNHEYPRIVWERKS